MEGDRLQPGSLRVPVTSEEEARCGKGGGGGRGREGGSHVVVHAPEADAEDLEDEEGGQQLFLQQFLEGWYRHLKLVGTPLVHGSQDTCLRAQPRALPIVTKCLLRPDTQTRQVSKSERPKEPRLLQCLPTWRYPTGFQCTGCHQTPCFPSQRRPKRTYPVIHPDLQSELHPPS